MQMSTNNSVLSIGLSAHEASLFLIYLGAVKDLRSENEPISKNANFMSDMDAVVEEFHKGLLDYFKLTEAKAR